MKGRGKAVMYLPAVEKSVAHALTGDPGAAAVSAERNDVPDIATFAGALLASLPRSKRRDAAALAVARADAIGPDPQPLVPVAALMPSDLTPQQTQRLVNGLFLLLLSAASSSADTSVGTMTANAAAMASGTPFASDPLSAERQNEVLLAKAILEAATVLGDEEAKQWFKDHRLSDALASMADGAAAGTTDADRVVATVDERLRDIYDCMAHEVPLGGDAKSTVSSFLSDLWKGAKDAVVETLSGKKDGAPAEASEMTRNTPGGTAGRAVESVRAKGAPALLDAPSKQATISATGIEQASDAAGSAVQSVTEGVTAARKALDDARAAMSEGQETLAGYRTKLQNAALQTARLQWAQALLEAPDSVALILSNVSPVTTDPGTFMQSVLNTIPAARQTGDLSTLRGLVAAVRSALTKGSVDGESLYSLITGDPTAELRDAEGRSLEPPVMADALMAYREAVRVSGGSDYSYNHTVELDSPSEVVAEMRDVQQTEGEPGWDDGYDKESSEYDSENEG